MNVEFVVSLRNKESLPRVIAARPDGVIIGALFSQKYAYSLDDLKSISNLLKLKKIKRYISIDSFLFESDKGLLIDYLEFVKSLNPDGIYFNDLAVYEIAKSYGMEGLMILDNDTLSTNSLDISFFLSRGLAGVVLARELTLDEVRKILKTLPGQVDMQIFGHQKLSTSRRKFLSNYQKETGISFPIRNNKALSLREEQRDYRLPIEEDEYGTRIYSDYVFEMYKELPELSAYLRRGIIDDNFIETGLLVEAIASLRRVNADNVDFIRSDIINKHPETCFSDAFLYRPTNKNKDE